jgi:peroxiredoxin
VAQLCQHSEELKKLNTEVLLVSFGTADSAKAWLKETCTSFQMLLDPHRKVYHRYGLGHSWRRSGNLRTLRRYVKLVRAGRKWRGIKGDPAQLGGDYVIGSDGTILLAHPSHEPTDRVSVSELVEALY